MKGIFSGCINLKEINIPSKLKNIGNEAFKDCPNLASISVDTEAVYVDDGNKVYDVEMQNKKLDCIEKRTRYYQSMIDVDNLSRGVKYSELKESFVIFICKKDPFDLNCPSYEVKSKIEGINFDEKGKKRKIRKNYNDETHKIFFNAASYKNETDKGLRAFLNFICNTETTDNNNVTPKPLKNIG